jgi:hypothetical protein
MLFCFVWKKPCQGGRKDITDGEKPSNSCNLWAQCSKYEPKGEWGWPVGEDPAEQLYTHGEIVGLSLIFSVEVTLSSMRRKEMRPDALRRMVEERCKF